MKHIQFLFVLFAITLLGCTPKPFPELIILDNQTGYPQTEFALEQIAGALVKVGSSVVPLGNAQAGLTIVSKENPELGFEAYTTSYDGKTLTLTGGDANGLMYAGIEVADMIALGKPLTEIGNLTGKPYVKKRGLRYNIPLDARTPSYDDTGDAAQENIATVWEWDYWKDYLDMMARNRYNVLSIWSLHPYPSWVKVPEYPEVALDNVCRYKGKVTAQTDMKWRNADIQNPDSLIVLKEMSIEEKMDFWKKVFQYAADRGVEIYLFHWNVFVNGAEGKYGITWAQDNDVTIDYIRKSVKAMLLAYPNIKGIGVTAGEHINRNLQGTEYAIEKWMWKTYGQGVMDARAENPDLDVRFIFRRHWSDLDAINEAFESYGSPIETSFKYSRARMYSSTTPPWFDKIYRSTVEKYQMNCWLNIRNDDIFTFRWGDPEYASEYMKNIPIDLTPGYYIGPDGYVWGRETVSKNPSNPRQYEFDKHWYRFMIWGNAGYNPNLGKEFYIEQLQLKFPETNAELLYETWKATSGIISWIDKIHFRQNDAQFAPEGCFDNKRFHDINQFIWNAEMPLQGVAGIGAYAKGESSQGVLSPFAVADSLDHAANILLAGAKKLKHGKNTELQSTLADFEALGYLGRYYAEKVRASTHVAMYRISGNKGDKDNAIAEAEKSVALWKQYAQVATQQYNPTLYARTGMMDWNAIADSTLKDIEIARNAQQGEEVKYGNNYLWEGDQRKF